jgi:hypothetical protein
MTSMNFLPTYNYLKIPSITAQLGLFLSPLQQLILFLLVTGLFAVFASQVDSASS